MHLLSNEAIIRDADTSATLIDGIRNDSSSLFSWLYAL